MDGETLSSAKLELWRALDRFEDQLRELRNVFFLGRGPSAWDDEAIRMAAAAVAQEETVTEDDVVRELLGEAYGLRHGLENHEFPRYSEIGRAAGAPGRQSKGLDGEALALRVKAEDQAQEGKINAALATAQRIENPYGRATACAAIAETQARSGDIEGALATARDIEDTCERGGGHGGRRRRASSGWRR